MTVPRYWRDPSWPKLPRLTKELPPHEQERILREIEKLKASPCPVEEGFHKSERYSRGGHSGIRTCRDPRPHALR